MRRAAGQKSIFSAPRTKGKTSFELRLEFLFLALGRRFAIDAADNSQVMMVELGGNAKFLLLNKLHRRGFSFAQSRD
jgi:hypothetical protein